MSTTLWDWRPWEIILDVCQLAFQWGVVPLCPHFILRRYIVLLLIKWDMNVINSIIILTSRVSFLLWGKYVMTISLLYLLSLLWWSWTLSSLSWGSSACSSYLSPYLPNKEFSAQMRGQWDFIEKNSFVFWVVLVEAQTRNVVDKW